MEGVQSYLARDWLERVCAEKTGGMREESAGAFNSRTVDSRAGT